MEGQAGSPSNLAQTIASVVDAIRKRAPSAPSASDMDLRIEVSEAARDGVSQPVLDAVLGEPSFDGLRSGWIHHCGYGHAFGPTMVTHLLVREGLRGGSLEALLDEAVQLAKTQSSTLLTYFPIAGVSLTEPIELAPKIFLVPWDGVPACDQKQKFSNDQGFASFPANPIFYQQQVFPRAAIRISRPPVRVIFPDSKSPLLKAARAERDEERHRELASDVAHCIVATAVSPISLLGYWHELGNAFAHRLAGVAYWWSREIFGVKVEPVPIRDQATRDLFSKFVKLSDGDKRVLRIGLHRLNQAIKEPQLVDRAIDQGIALEALLLHGGDLRSELRYRQAIRGAFFLGGSKADRLRNYDTLRHAYDLRSVAVHSGMIEQAHGDALNVLVDAALLCAAVARQVIERGSFPDWEKDIVIGA